MAAPAWGTRERPWPIAVSTLDAWKWFNQSEMTDEEFRHRLEHQDKPTVEAQVGQALHRAVEVLMMDVRTGGPVSLQSLVGMHREEPDVSFLFALDSGLDINLDHCMIVEQDVQWTINTGLGWVTLRGITDAIHGTVIRDIKTTRSFKATRYQDSWQWRAYLAMMGPQFRQFQYQVFVLAYPPKEVKRKLDLARTKPGRQRQVNVKVVGYHEVNCTRYPLMVDHLKNVTAELAAYLHFTEWDPSGKRQMETLE